MAAKRGAARGGRGVTGQAVGWTRVMTCLVVMSCMEEGRSGADVCVRVRERWGGWVGGVQVQVCVGLQLL